MYVPLPTPCRAGEPLKSTHTITGDTNQTSEVGSS